MWLDFFQYKRNPGLPEFIFVLTDFRILTAYLEFLMLKLLVHTLILTLYWPDVNFSPGWWWLLLLLLLLLLGLFLKHHMWTPNKKPKDYTAMPKFCLFQAMSALNHFVLMLTLKNRLTNITEYKKKQPQCTNLLTYTYVPLLSAEQRNELRALLMNQTLKVVICRVTLMWSRTLQPELI